MIYPFKYLLIAERDDVYSISTFKEEYCDIAEANSAYSTYYDDGYKVSLYRILKFNNFDL